VTLGPDDEFIVTMQSVAEIYGLYDVTLQWVDDAHADGVERTVRVNPHT
jgi:hypothetical protein